MTNRKTNIVPFEMKYLNEYYDGFNTEITKYQWPDPFSEDCPEVGVWICEPEQGKGYAYEALSYILHFAQDKYGKKNFFYEADVRNVGSTKLLNKFSNLYEINTLGVEELVTDSGKELKLQGSIMKVK